MKKIESLNNAQKTVLKLEKEINEISNNLSKVKNKDHTTMKKIINNINYLLTKDEYGKMVYKEELSEDREDNKKYESKVKNNELNENKHIYNENNMDRDIDYLLLLNKQRNNNNNSGHYYPKKPYFNRKCISSSKININNTSGDKKSFQVYNTKTNIYKKDNNYISNRNKNVSLSNQIMNKTTQMTYSKPRLMTEYSKRNYNNNIYKNNTVNTNRKKEIPIKNIKYLTLNEKINNSCKHKKSSILNSLYYNYKDNSEYNFLNNNNIKEKNNNKIAYLLEQTEIINKQKGHTLNNLYEKNEKTNDNGFKKNKKLISEKKLKSNHYIELNSNSNNKKNIYNNSSNKYHSNNYSKNNKNVPFLSLEDEDSNKSNISEKSIKKENNKYVFSLDKHNLNEIIDNDNNFAMNSYKIQRNLKNNYFNKNYSKSFNSNNIVNNSNKKINNNNTDNIITNDKDNINFLLNMLNVNNINEGIMKVNELLLYEKNINKLKQLYNDNNDENYQYNNEDIWLSNVIKNYKRNEKYKNFCQNIMNHNNLTNFEDFKMFLKSLLKKDKNNKYNTNEKLDKFLDNIYSNNKINNSKNNKRKNINYKNKYRDKYSNNNEDINFTNLQNL